MTELIRNWVLGLTAAAFIASLAMTLTPKGKIRAVVGLATGLMTIVALIAPVMDFDYAAYARHMAASDFVLESKIGEVEYAQERLTSLIIIQRSQAYILDKAESLGLSDLTVVVETMLDENRIPYPYEIWLTGPYTAEVQEILEHFLVGTFGIPTERQHWSLAE